MFDVRRGKKINMVLVLLLLKMRGRVREIFFFTAYLYQLTKMDLSLKHRVYEKHENKGVFTLHAESRL